MECRMRVERAWSVCHASYMRDEDRQDYMEKECVYENS